MPAAGTGSSTTSGGPSPASARSRRTRSRVHATDALAGTIITFGGIGVIAAVLGLMLYLMAEVLPLFRSGSLAAPTAATLTQWPAPSPAKTSTNTSTTVRDGPALLAIDEYGVSAASLWHDGTLRVHAVKTGARVLERRAFEASATAISWVTYEGLVAVGFGDGTVRLGSLTFDAKQATRAQVHESLRDIPIGTTAPDPQGTDAGAIVERQGEDQFRIITPTLALREPVAIEGGSGAIARIDYRRSADREMLVVVRADGTTLVEAVTTITPLGGGKPRTRLETTPVAFVPPQGRGLPLRAFVTADATSVLALWDDGLTQRYSLTGAEQAPQGAAPLIETVPLLEQGRRVTASTMMIGGLTLLIGDDKGFVHGAFAARDPVKGAADGHHLVCAHSLAVLDAPIVNLAVSHRNRCFVAADASGSFAVWNLSAHKRVTSHQTQSGALWAAEIMPKFDAIATLDKGGSLVVYPMEGGHPEASWRSLFGKVHYEGESQPGYSYQSSSASDSSEPKLSLRPLIHGTLKGTLFALIFAVPIAVLAAIYTSEFLVPKVRLAVKPAIEMMASLPSVVLGFVTAIIIAPFVASVTSGLLLGLVVVPVVLLVGAHLWQLLPTRSISRLGGVWRTALIALAMAFAVLLSIWLGPIVERALFRPTRADTLVAAGLVEKVPQESWPAWVGRRASMSPDVERQLRAEGLAFQDGGVVRAIEPRDDNERARLDQALAQSRLAAPSLRAWLDGNIGTAAPGWFVLVFPAAAIAIAVLQRRFFGRHWDAILAGQGRIAAGLLCLAKLALALIACAAVALVAARVLTTLGLDPRDLVMGPYNQRNALVVGLIMGFAVIPVIYTISEDAMSSVPASLRSASLGAGATRWQTAIRVVLPVAASGIFSAIMIGLGRAVGETMIVVMATGNTPSMDWSMFSGFRTLSANIAVELPEAPQGSTHYRVLFLCGLVLFVLTFVVNTTAEIVRQHFRRRNAAL